MLTAGQKGDAPQAERLLAGWKRGQIGSVLADAAYDSDAIRRHCRSRRCRSIRARVCIKPNPTRKTPKAYDRRTYRNRNQVERFSGRIKRCRRVAARYDQKPQNSAGFVWLAALISDLF